MRGGYRSVTCIAYSPQTNGICERFRRTIKAKFYDFAFRRNLFIKDELQKDADQWLKYYNDEQPHSGKYCYGKTPMQTFRDSKKIALENLFFHVFLPLLLFNCFELRFCHLNSFLNHL